MVHLSFYCLLDRTYVNYVQLKCHLVTIRRLNSALALLWYVQRLLTATFALTRFKAHVPAMMNGMPGVGLSFYLLLVGSAVLDKRLQVFLLDFEFPAKLV